MKLNNQQLINFVNKIKFSTTHKSKYKEQIDNLIEELKDYLLYNSNLSVNKVIQAGSWRKGTILMPHMNTPLDIDLAFFMNINKVKNINDIHEMNGKIIEFLIKIYPSKKKTDFKENAKTANVKFITSGLSVDIVPVIDIDPIHINGLSNYVKQPDSETFTYYVTSVKGQLDFIINRKNANANFTAIVRILKHWKYFHSLPISSFSIELIAAYLDIRKGVNLSIEESIIRFFILLSSKKFPVITFNAPYGLTNTYRSYVYIADPTNNENNSTKYLTKDDWSLIQKAASDALDTLIYAQVCNQLSRTVNLWKEILGNNFTV